MPKITPRAPRWTADTQIAFLLALRLTGSATAACAAIGRSVQGTYKRRRNCPAFAQAWADVIAELQRDKAAAAQDAAGGIAVGRIRYDGFTPRRRRAFLRALGETGRFDAAAKHVGVSVSGVTKLRRRDPAFDADCAAALTRSTAVLEQAAIDRAVHGVEEPVYHAGERIGTRRRYSDALLRFMLARDDSRAGATLAAEQRTEAARHAAAAAGGTFEFYAKPGETDKALVSILDRLEKKRAHRDRMAALDAEEAERAAAAALPAPDTPPESDPAPAIRHT